MATKEAPKLDEDLANLLNDEAIANDEEPAHDEEPADEAQDYLPKYMKQEDPTEEGVNALLSLGYKLLTITPVTQEFVRKDGYHISYDTVLVYHFIWEG